jgi:hypothetical protein
LLIKETEAADKENTISFLSQKLQALEDLQLQLKESEIREGESN